MGKVIGLLRALLSLPLPSRVEDTGTIMAARPTRKAECRYLGQWVSEMEAAQGAGGGRGGDEEAEADNQDAGVAAGAVL